MIYKQPSGNAGEYYPAFFEMRLKVDSMIDLNTSSDSDFALFFHEYVHFLQDLMTTYGLTNCYYVGECIQSAVNDIYQNGTDGKIKVPYCYGDNKDNIQIEELIRNVTMGDISETIPILSNLSWEKESFTNIPKVEKIKEITGICVYANETDVFSFGAYAIKESMAYILERLLTCDYQKSDDYPYCAAERLVEMEYPEFGKNILNVLALCDCSLMFSNPSHVFYDILKDMRKKKYIPSKPQDLYGQLCNARIGVGDTKIDIFAHFKIIAEETRKKLKSYFNIPQHP